MFSLPILPTLWARLTLKVVAENTFCFVKIISLKSSNCVLALRKRLFCNAKPTLLPCKTAAFGMQNNSFCNTLITRQLHNNYAYEKYLQFYRFLLVPKVGFLRYTSTILQRLGRKAKILQKYFESQPTILYI